MILPEPLPPAPSSRLASPVLAYAGIPLGSLFGVVVLAWIHEALGAPLGPGWGTELWTAIKTGALVITPVYVGVAYRVEKHNARVEALYAAHHRTEGPADSLTGGRRLPTGSHPSISASAHKLIVMDRHARTSHLDEKE